MPATTSHANQVLRAHLTRLIQQPIPPPAPPGQRPTPEFHIETAPDASTDSTQPIDVVVSINEINDRHGTGPLVKRIFKDRRNIFSIRSRDDWGVQDFGDWNVAIPQEGRSRPDCFRNILSVLGGRKVGRVVCVPFLIDEVITAIAIKECFDASLCVWVMDDQNIATNVIPDTLMRECLEKSSLRLATHPELCRAYERKYGLPFYVLPAVVPEQLVAVDPVPPVIDSQRKGALIGSFWDQTWFDRLCSALEGSGWEIDWFGNNKSPWFQYPAEKLERAGITPFGIVPEERLANELRKYPFVLVPAGALDAGESNKGVASLSLPGRILFAVASSHAPILLVGSERTCGARFVRHFRIGEVVPYDAAAIRAAIARLASPDVQRQMRRNAAAIAPGLSDRGIVEWLAGSIERGRPVDGRFEDIFEGYDEDVNLDLANSRARAGASGAR